MSNTADNQVVTREEAEGWCAEYEPALRRLFAPGSLPPAWEAQLEAAPFDGTAKGAIRRFGLLKGFYIARQQINVAGTGGRSVENKNEVMRQLIEREPVAVQLASGRVVHIRSRSWNAYYQIGAHAIRINWLNTQLDRLGEAYTTVFRDGQAGARSPWRNWRRLFPFFGKLRRLEKMHRDVYAELLHQRARMYTHVFRDHPGPAPRDEAPPPWWSEITPADDPFILAALFEAGHGRWDALGPVPPSTAKVERAEDFGFQSLIHSLERNLPIHAAPLGNEGLGWLKDADLFQLLAWTRVSADPQPVRD